MHCCLFGRRRGLTVLELLVVVAVIGILGALVLPALVSAREAARRITCVSNLREIGLALHQHHEARGSLPRAWRSARGGFTAYGWAVALLPYLEQATLSDSLDCWVPITSPSVASARETSLGIMLCPSDIAEPSFALYVEEEDADNARHALSRSTRARRLIAHLPTANYLGVFGTIEPDDTFPAPAGDGVFVAHQAVRFDDLRRGLSRTLVVGERTMAMVPSTWLGISFRGEDAACRLVGSAITTPNCDPCDECEFSSRHAGGANFLWADGHVGLIPKQTDSAEYRRLARRALSLSEPPKGSVLWKRAN